MNTRTFIIAIALLAGAAAAHAQDGRLARVQNLIATGRLTEARNTLTQWERDNGDPRSDATSDDRARALYLTGVLSTDAKAAEDAFISVVLSYPSSPVAPEALLRLGQGLYTAGETDRAIAYLERLRSDYPGSPQRETALLWLTRAQLAAGDAATACGTARESLFGTINENVRTLMELERDRACAQSGGIATRSAPETRTRTARLPVTGSEPPDRSQPVTGTEPRDRAQPVTRTEPPAQPVPDTMPAAGARAGDTRGAPPVRTANPLPDLGIAVDDNIPAPPRREQARPDRTTTDPRATDPRNRTEARAAETRNADDTRTANDPDAAAPARADDSSSRTDRAPANAPEFAVQAAAFSERRPAETIVAEMRAKGFDARIVQVPGSPYFRVRWGAFVTSRDAAAAALRIRDAGFATLIVNDVRLEQRL
jgi:cell division protein FtsN